MLHLVLAVAGGPWMGVWTRQLDETQPRQQTAQIRKESQQNHETLPSPSTGCKENATKKHKFQPDQGTSVVFSLEPSMRRHWTPSSFRCSRRNCSSCGCSDSPRSRRSTSRAVRTAEQASREWHGNVTPREDRKETWLSGAPCGGRWVTLGNKSACHSLVVMVMSYLWHLVAEELHLETAQGPCAEACWPHTQKRDGPGV